MDSNEIKKLADLARIDMSEEEMKEIANDFESILAYVGQVQEVSGEIIDHDKKPEDYFTRNVTRDDVTLEDNKKRSDKVLANAPDIQDGFIKVRKIM